MLEPAPPFEATVCVNRQLNQAVHVFTRRLLRRLHRKTRRRIYWTMVWIPPDPLQTSSVRYLIPSCNGPAVTHVLQSDVRWSQTDQERDQSRRRGPAQWQRDKADSRRQRRMR